MTRQAKERPADRLAAALDAFPLRWQPMQARERLIGVVIGFVWRGKAGAGAFPIVTLLTEDGEEWSIYGGLLTSILARVRPHVGDSIGVLFVGPDPDTGTDMFRVVCERRPTYETASVEGTTDAAEDGSAALWSPGNGVVEGGPLSTHEVSKGPS
jgi:hypothetical protein